MNIQGELNSNGMCDLRFHLASKMIMLCFILAGCHLFDIYGYKLEETERVSVLSNQLY